MPTTLQHKRTHRPAAPSAVAGAAPWSLLEQIENHVGPITVADAARLRGCSVKTIYKAIAAKRIPCVNDGIGVVIIDPKTWAYVLRRKDAMMREAERRG